MKPSQLALLFALGASFAACSHGGSSPPAARLSPYAGRPGTPIDLAEAYRWLYEGPSATQLGVAPGTIERERMALVHGTIVDDVGQPLAGARVEVAGQPQYGHTRSRADGSWSLAVNGGSGFELRMTAAGRAPVQRQVNPGWRGQYTVDAVSMVRRAGAAAALSANAASSQIVVGDVSSDADGVRRALLFVPPATTATAVLPSGQQQVLPTFTVRATEFTVGANGPSRMPADYAGNIAYTYCIEYVCDEAEAIGALTVRFDRPLVHYVENFLDFPVGSPVPTGYYDKQAKAWVAANDGVVVRVLDVQNGRAVLDLIGDGQPATTAQLQALGVSDDERQRLGALHGAGTSLWRVRIEHFTPWDCNWPYGPPQDAEPPQVEAPGDDGVFDAATEDQDVACGSLVLVQDQVLVESVEIPGTGMRLVYRSDREAGFQSRTRVPLTKATLPPGLKRVEFVAEVAGHRFEESFPPAPRLVHEVVWDGKDWTGRRLQGRQRMNIAIGYVYDATYQQPAQLLATFGQFSGVPMTGNRARQEITLWQHLEGKVGGFDARGLGNGGWTLDAHHVYDADARILVRGDGTDETRGAKGAILDTYAGVPQTPGFSGDGGPAKAARMMLPTDVRVGPDGLVYFIQCDAWGFQGAVSALRRVDRAGIVTTVAGGLPNGFAGDGGPATSAQLDSPHQFAFAADASIWICDTLNHCIRRVRTDGIIETVVGQPRLLGFGGDGGPARNARLDHPTGIAFAPDGSCYFTDQGNHRVRRVGTDGTISTVLGSLPGDSGDDGPASQARTFFPDGIAVDRQGNVYFCDRLLPTIRCIGVDGIVRRVAGDGIDWHDGDGGPARDARISSPNGIHITRDGSLLFAEYNGECIRRIAPDGIITTIAGTPFSKGFFGDGGRATDALLDHPNSVCEAPDGTIYIAETVNHIIRRVQSPWPGFGSDEKAVVEADGSMIHVFDENGRHLRSEAATTADVMVRYEYDAAGRLVAVTTTAGTTSLDRDAAGNLVAVTSPGGKRTTCSVDGDGLLVRITTPDGRALQFGYDAGGLLTRIRYADGTEQTFAYDAVGRLVRDTDASGRALNLARSQAWDRTTVTLTTTANRSQSYETRPGAAPGEELRIRTDCCARTETSRFADGSTEVRRQDGVVVRQSLRDDPIFGGAVRVPSELVIRVPGANNGPLGEITALFGSQAVLDDPGDPRSVRLFQSVANIGGRSWYLAYDRDAGTVRETAPSGRVRVTHLDARRRAQQIEVPGDAPIDFEYDAADRLVAMTQTAGGRVRRTTFAYDADGILSRVTDPLGHELLANRDGNGRVTGLVRDGLPGGAIEYGAAAQLVAVTPPGRPAHTFERDLAGRLTAYRAPGAQPIRFTRDTDGLITGIDLAAEQAVTIARASGTSRITGCTVGAPRTPGAIAFVHDPVTGMLANSSTPEGVTRTFTHHGPLPHTVQTAVAGVPLPVVSYAYDASLRLSSFSVAGQTVSIDRDADGLPVVVGAEQLVRDGASGRLDARQVGSTAVVHEFLLDGFAELDRLVASRGGTVLFQEDYTRDLGGRVTRVVDALAGTSVEYSYDDQGRLATVRVAGAVVHDLRFDANGNVTQDAATGRAYAVDALDRLVQAGNVAFAYDAAGRLRSRTASGQVTQYRYDVFGNLVEVVLPGSTVRYLVDAANQRTQRLVGGAVTNSWVRGADGRLLAESRDGTTWRTFVYASSGTVPDVMLEGSTRYLIVHDHLGSVRRVVQANSGAVVQALDYDPWGNVVRDTNPGFQPFGYAGGLYDPATGFLRFGARDYSPEMLRWTARDPSLFGGGTTNLYEYCGGDPVNHVDPAGRFPILVMSGIGAVFGGVAAGGLQVYGNWQNGNGLTDGLMGAAVGGAVAGGLSVWSAPFAGSVAAAIGLGGSTMAMGAMAATYGGASNGVGQVINNWIEGRCWTEGLPTALALGATGTAFSALPWFHHPAFSSVGSLSSWWESKLQQEFFASIGIPLRPVLSPHPGGFWLGNMVGDLIGSLSNAR